MTEKLASERVVYSAPMSFAGSAQRAWKLTHVGDNIASPWGRIPAKILLVLGVLLLIGVWWVACLVWYVIFGLLLVPYRLIRRGSRKRKAEEMRHREVLDATKKRE